MLVRMTESNMPQAFEIVGDPGWIRTSDLQLRRLLLHESAGTRQAVGQFMGDLDALLLNL